MATHNSSEPVPINSGKTSQPGSRMIDDEMDGDTYHDSLRGHTQADRADMYRMGKVQELRRNYRPLSALAFTVILQGTWEVLMT
jgi:choline transport protein